MHDAMSSMARFEQLLHRYNDTLAQSMSDTSLVPEFVANGDNPKAPRQLCQTRGIIYCVHMARQFGDEAAAQRAAAIYRAVQRDYLVAHTCGEITRYAPTPSTDGGALYELAFLLNAQVHLHQLPAGVIDERQLNADMAATIEVIMSVPTAAIFKPRESGAFSELNAAMHLFEALCLRLQLGPQTVVASKVDELLAYVDRWFYDDARGMLAERITSEGELLEYDLGHNYEWSSLLWLNDNLGLNFRRLDPARMASAAEAVAQAHFEPAMVAHQLDANGCPLDPVARIWVSLERARALALAGDVHADEVLARVLAHFFPDGLPEEYSGKRGPIKSTTGYHVIECYMGILRAA